MAGPSRTIVLTPKGHAAVREMRLHDAVPEIPANGWPPERKPKAIGSPKPVPKPKPEPSSREKAIENAAGRDIFLSPAFVLPGDKLLRIVAGDRLCVGTVTRVERIGASFRLHLAQGGWKTCGASSAVLVAPRGDK